MRCLNNLEPRPGLAFYFPSVFSSIPSSRAESHGSGTFARTFVGEMVAIRTSQPKRRIPIYTCSFLTSRLVAIFQLSAHTRMPLPLAPNPRIFLSGRPPDLPCLQGGEGRFEPRRSDLRDGMRRWRWLARGLLHHLRGLYGRGLRVLREPHGLRSSHARGLRGVRSGVGLRASGSGGGRWPTNHSAVVTSSLFV